MIEIKEMQFDDLEGVMEIENANFSKPWTETGFFTFLIRDDTLFLVAAEEDRILGYCGIVMAQEEGDITNVSVAKNVQNMGIGQRLMEELLIRTKEKGIQKIFLEVRESNQQAIHVYEKIGFKQISIRKNYYESPVENGLVMLYIAE